MKRAALILALGLSLGSSTFAQTFEDYFVDKTLRLDYIFMGNADKQDICLDELSVLPQWAGRRHHLSELPLEGNGEITMKDKATGKVIYRTSFSSLFQEWIGEQEAKVVKRGFENTFLVPYPKQPAEITVVLRNASREVSATLVHEVNPSDILIHQRGEGELTPHRYLWQGGSADKCIDVAIMAEGYSANESDLFYKDAAVACEALFAHEPFKKLKDRFNIVAVFSESKDSGVSIPRKDEWKKTAVSSHFDTFYSDRYLTTRSVKAIHNWLAGIPYEHIIILANTDVYGGGGIYNSYTLTTAHHPMFKPVVVHEFGHSFGGLADEYFYDDDVMTDTYPLDVEPWEQNISTRVNFASKWEDMLAPNTPVPTPVAQHQNYPVGVYEGGGYSAKGIYRPAFNCRMKTNEYPEFCPVCQCAIQRIIEFYVP